MELNVSNEVYAELMDALSWRRSSTLESLCARALSSYIIRYCEETVPLLNMDPKRKARLAKESRQELYALCYEGLIENKRKKNAERDGNVVKLANSNTRPTFKDFLNLGT